MPLVVTMPKRPSAGRRACKHQSDRSWKKRASGRLSPHDSAIPDEDEVRLLRCAVLRQAVEIERLTELIGGR